jgi:hypothetical protein
MGPLTLQVGSGTPQGMMRVFSFLSSSKRYIGALSMAFVRSSDTFLEIVGTIGHQSRI